MGVTYNTSIVRDGLILHLDPANKKCFKSGDSTCRNMITGGLVTGANGSPGSGAHTPNPSNFPVYSPEHGGVFDFLSGRGMNCEEDLGGHQAFALTFWFYKPTSSTSNYLSDARADGGQWFLANYQNFNISYTGVLRYNFGGSYSASNPDFIGKWHCLTVTSDSSGSAMYLNGVKVASAASLNENLGKNFRIGTRYTTSGPWDGLMGPIMAHNRALDPVEVARLFHAYRSRYGL